MDHMFSLEGRQDACVDASVLHPHGVVYLYRAIPFLATRGHNLNPLLPETKAQVCDAVISVDD